MQGQQLSKPLFYFSTADSTQAPPENHLTASTYGSMYPGATYYVATMPKTTYLLVRYHPPSKQSYPRPHPEIISTDTSQRLEPYINSLISPIPPGYVLYFNHPPRHVPNLRTEQQRADMESLLYKQHVRALEQERDYPDLQHPQPRKFITPIQDPEPEKAPKYVPPHRRDGWVARTQKTKQPQKKLYVPPHRRDTQGQSSNLYR